MSEVYHMNAVYVDCIDTWLELDCEGRFTLPDRPYTAAQLRKIAAQVNKAIRVHQLQIKSEEASE